MNSVNQHQSQAQYAAQTLDQQRQLWLDQLDAAQQCWTKVSRAELLQSEGLPHRLSRLLQEHYALSRDQAEHQINRFKQSYQFTTEPQVVTDRQI
jgi:hypothetical protein